MKTKEIKDFYKKSQYFLRENQSEELIGIPFLSPHLPRSIILENNRIKLNFFVKLFNFVLRFFLSNENYNYYSKQNYKHLILSHLVSYDNLNYDKINKQKILLYRKNY